ncbi:hypothetical protein OSH66_19405 [Mycobacterium ulcerans]
MAVSIGVGAARGGHPDAVELGCGGSRSRWPNWESVRGAGGRLGTGAPDAASAVEAQGDWRPWLVRESGAGSGGGLVEFADVRAGTSARVNGGKR